MRLTSGIVRHSAVSLGILLLVSASSAVAGTVAFDPNATKISEEKLPEPTLKFKYRLVPTAEVTATEVASDGKVVESRATPYADNPLNLSAMLILVDTSVGTAKLPRNTTIELNRQVIADILNRSRPNNLIGISTFANDLVELTPVGAPVADNRAALARLKADGMGTRLYRRAMDAIEKLAAVKADRKALLIFSDGKDEDTGFKLEDLQAAAKKANVMVLAVGCPESAQDVPALGNLERLGAESLGYYAQMPLVAQAGVTRPQIPPGLADALLGSLVGGGEVVASLKDADPAGKVSVTLTTKDGQKLEQSLQLVPAATPTPAPAPSATPDASATPAVSATPTPTPTPTKAEAASAWAQQNKGWVIAGAVALLGLLGIIIAAVATRKKKAPPADLGSFIEPAFPPAIEPAQNAAFAYLVMQDAEASRMPITKTASRIGRRGDNDIVFSNDSVSGHHAEIHMGRDGAFSITDLGSGNGVVVNGKRLTQSGLHEGDLVELGEVRFRFTLAR
jgi:cell division septation protein DedD